MYSFITGCVDLSHFCLSKYTYSTSGSLRLSYKGCHLLVDYRDKNHVQTCTFDALPSHIVYTGELNQHRNEDFHDVLKFII